MFFWLGLSLNIECNTSNESYQNERDLEVVQIWDCTIMGWVIFLKNFPKKHVSEDNHVEKSYVGLWTQS